MTPRELEEYRALRATIRERGTARMWLLPAGLLGWAGLTIATAALFPLPIATLLPLFLLDVVFEVVYALHRGVERIGRYIQVFFENEQDSNDNGSARDGHSPAPSERPATQRWEHVAMEFGRAFPGKGGNPLFPLLFGAAAVLNFVPVTLAEPAPVEIVVVGAAHLLFLARVVIASRTAAHQRAKDLERFERLRNSRL